MRNTAQIRTPTINTGSSGVRTATSAAIAAMTARTPPTIRNTGSISTPKTAFTAVFAIQKRDGDQPEEHPERQTERQRDGPERHAHHECEQSHHRTEPDREHDEREDREHLFRPDDADGRTRGAMSTHDESPGKSPFGGVLSVYGTKRRKVSGAARRGAVRS